MYAIEGKSKKTDTDKKKKKQKNYIHPENNRLEKVLSPHFLKRAIGKEGRVLRARQHQTETFSGGIDSKGG